MKKTGISLFVLFLAAVYFMGIPRAPKGEVRQDQTTKVTILLTEDLEVDSSGEQVVILQSALRSDSSLYTGPVSGFFTITTKDAVIRFQKKYLLPQTGEMDLVSRLKFNEIYGKSNTIDLYGGKEKWGIAEKVVGTQYGWSMKIENDFTMGTAQEIFFALNRYRLKKNRGELNWSGSLANFAQQRAESLTEKGGVDDHKGFREYIHNEDFRKTLGFSRVGENTSCGYRMTAVHMIEWIFAGDVPHDDNQLNEKWSDVGVGVSGTCVSLVFGYNRK